MDPTGPFPGSVRFNLMMMMLLMSTGSSAYLPLGVLPFLHLFIYSVLSKMDEVVAGLTHCPFSPSLQVDQLTRYQPDKDGRLWKLDVAIGVR